MQRVPQDAYRLRDILMAVSCLVFDRTVLYFSGCLAASKKMGWEREDVQRWIYSRP